MCMRSLLNCNLTKNDEHGLRLRHMCTFILCGHQCQQYGNIATTVLCDGNSIPVTGLGTASPRANTKVGEASQAAVDAVDADGSSPAVNTRCDATVAVNAPEDDITPNVRYKGTAADGATDRGVLETSDSLPAVSEADR
jgi:hypothetical protein